MGCLKNFLRAIIITLAVVGFMAIGGKDLISRYINNYFNPTKDEMLERAKKVGDFSHINDEFEIEKAAGILGYNAVVAEHKASGQKMFVVDSGDKQILTEEDLKSVSYTHLVPILYVLAVFQVFDGLQVALAGIFKGMKRTGIVLLSNFIAYWLIAIPVSYTHLDVYKRQHQALQQK